MFCCQVCCIEIPTRKGATIQTPWSIGNFVTQIDLCCRRIIISLREILNVGALFLDTENTVLLIINRLISVAWLVKQCATDFSITSSVRCVAALPRSYATELPACYILWMLLRSIQSLVRLGFMRVCSSVFRPNYSPKKKKKKSNRPLHLPERYSVIRFWEIYCSLNYNSICNRKRESSKIHRKFFSILLYYKKPRTFLIEYFLKNIWFWLSERIIIMIIL